MMNIRNMTSPVSCLATDHPPEWAVFNFVSSFSTSPSHPLTFLTATIDLCRYGLRLCGELNNSFSIVGWPADDVDRDQIFAALSPPRFMTTPELVVSAHGWLLSRRKTKITLVWLQRFSQCTAQVSILLLLIPTSNLLAYQRWVPGWTYRSAFFNICTFRVRVEGYASSWGNSTTQWMTRDDKNGGSLVLVMVAMEPSYDFSFRDNL